MLNLTISVGGFVKYSESLLELSFKLNVIFKHFFNMFFAVALVYVFDKVGSNLFGGGATHVAGYKRSVVNGVYVLAVELKVEVELEDPFLKLSSVSMVKVRPSNLVAASLGFVRGVY